jgi:hypothetical protein
VQYTSMIQVPSTEFLHCHWIITAHLICYWKFWFPCHCSKLICLSCHCDHLNPTFFLGTSWIFLLFCFLEQHRRIVYHFISSRNNVQGWKSTQKTKTPPQKRILFTQWPYCPCLGCPDLWTIITVEKHISSLIYSLCLINLHAMRRAPLATQPHHLMGRGSDEAWVPRFPCRL